VPLSQNGRAPDQNCFPPSVAAKKKEKSNHTRKVYIRDVGIIFTLANLPPERLLHPPYQIIRIHHIGYSGSIASDKPFVCAVYRALMSHVL